MQAWLAVLTEKGIQEGALFRRIRKGVISESPWHLRPCATS
jgi:hypothetical protein